MSNKISYFSFAGADTIKKILTDDYIYIDEKEAICINQIASELANKTKTDVEIQIIIRSVYEDSNPEIEKSCLICKISSLSLKLIKNATRKECERKVGSHFSQI